MYDYFVVKYWDGKLKCYMVLNLEFSYYINNFLFYLLGENRY